MSYQTYTLIDWLLFFYIYCFIGWCIESTYVSLHEHRFVNRGFMRGPFLPIYGSGAIVMLFVTIPVRSNFFLTFLFGAIGASILEYCTGAVMEALFKVRYWDYSHIPLNLNGHICLPISIAWGGLTLLMVNVVHHPVETLVFLIPRSIEIDIVIFLTITIAADFALSFKAALDIRDVLVRLAAAKEEMEKVQTRLDALITSTGEKFTLQAEETRDRLSGSLNTAKAKLDFLKRFSLKEDGTIRRQFLSFREELEQLTTKYIIDNEYRKALSSRMNFFRKDLLRAHPSMTSPKFNEALKELREIIEEKNPIRKK